MDKKKQGKLILMIIAIIVIVVACMNTIQTVISARYTRYSVGASYEENYNTIATAYSEVISTRISEYIKQLRMYVESDVTQTGDPEEIQKWLVSHTSSRPSDYDRIGFVDLQGNFRNDQNKTSQVSDRSYYQNIVNKRHDTDIDDPVTSKSTGSTIIHASQAARINGNIIGFYSAVIGIEKIASIVKEIRIGKSGYALLADSTGKTIVTSIPGVSDGDEASASPIVVALSPIITKALSGQSGGEWVTYNGGKVFASYSPVKDTPWAIVFIVDQKQVYLTATNLRLIMIINGFAVGTILMLILGFAIYTAIKPLQFVQNTVDGIASGNADLTKRIELKQVHNNEIGGVVKGFNRFIEKLQTIVTAIKTSKDKLVSTGNKLSDSTADTASSITEIIANIESMGNNISSQADSVNSTAGAVNQIAGNINSLNDMVSNQVKSVMSASDAVHQMVNNINAVNTSMESMVSSFTTLEQNAVTGAQRQEDVNHLIDDIQSQSENLQEANAVISSIAEQTNLLAMNAAIEAAHAGEAGKGFSVVADEIRKLSETSSSQSRTIGEQLKNIQDTITDIVAASKASQKAFDSVTEGIRGTNSIVQKVRTSMQEQAEGSKQIQDTLRIVNNNSDEVRSASQEMAEGNKAILDEIKNLQDATATMKQGMEEMSIGAQKINETGALLSTLSDEIAESISAIGEQIDQFSV